MDIKPLIKPAINNKTILGTLPRILTFDITYRCNLRCKICKVWQFSEFKLEDELTTQEIIDIIKSFTARFPIRIVRFLGGEPFIRPDVIDIIATIPKTIKTEIVTNGALITQELAKKIVECGLTYLRFSIDGTQEYEDSIRGKGTYQKAIAAIDYVNQAKLEIKSSLPEVTVEPVFHLGNYQCLPDMYRLAQEMKIGFSYSLISEIKHESIKSTYFKGQPIGCIRTTDPKDLQLKNSMKRKLMNQYNELKMNKNSIRRYLKRIGVFLRMIYGGIRYIVYSDCIKSKITVLIDPWGNLYSCEYLYYYHFGNVRINGSDTWFNEEHQNIRKPIMSGDLKVCRECNINGYCRESHRHIPFIKLIKKFL